MLQKINRLPAHVTLFHPRFFTSKIFSLRIGETKLDYPRVGFVVSKKIDARATARNRIRRLFRSCIEEQIPKISGGIDMLFFLKSEILEMEREKLYNEVHNFLVEKSLLR